MHTGLLPDPRPIEQKAPDFIMGAENALETYPRTSEWKPYLSTGIPQSAGFDTMSCVSFAIGQEMETQMNFDFPSYSQELKDWLTQNGYIHDGKVFLSKRFTAITSGTTTEGNYFFKVYDSARHIGLIPDSDLPFGGNSTAEYLGAHITPQMYAKATEFLKRFVISYQLVNGYDKYSGFTPLELSVSREALKVAPLTVGIPIPSGHAILMHAIRDTEYDALDHYVPYLRTNNAQTIPVNYAYMGFIRPVEAPLKPKIALTRDLKAGDRGEDVKELQNVLKYEKCFPIEVQSTGYFGEFTKQAVIKFQEKYAEEILKPLNLAYSTGYVGASSRKWLAQHYQ